MDTRRRAFKNPAEQHAHILDVVTRYAIHYGDKGVAFACKVQCSSVYSVYHDVRTLCDGGVLLRSQDCTHIVRFTLVVVNVTTSWCGATLHCCDCCAAAMTDH
jgi:hypothetical protein